LLNLLNARESGQLRDADGFDARVREAVAEVVEKQVQAGVDIVNDGEQGRVDFATYATYSLSGFGSKTPFPGTTGGDREEFPELYTQQPNFSNLMVPLCDGPITYQSGPVQAATDNLTAAASGSGAARTFLTAVSPGEMSVFMPNGFYRSQDDYLAALTAAMRQEYESIYRAGHLVQLDAPDLALGFHTYFSGSTIEEFRRKVAAHIGAINEATANIPPEAMRLHICYGPGAGPHNHDVELREVLDIILTARPAGLNFEAANCRHEHDWQLFKDRFKLPEGKYLIPGVIDITTNRIEHPELVAERIVRLAKVVGRENVVAGTDCGFATIANLKDRVVPSCVWAKLRSLAEGARIASQDLW
jgi:5-methyltetrahydropteroyltriglutamate--homocysteine methyltransferase